MAKSCFWLELPESSLNAQIDSLFSVLFDSLGTYLPRAGRPGGSRGVPAAVFGALVRADSVTKLTVSRAPVVPPILWCFGALLAILMGWGWISGSLGPQCYVQAHMQAVFISGGQLPFVMRSRPHPAVTRTRNRMEKYFRICRWKMFGWQDVVSYI